MYLRDIEIYTLSKREDIDIVSKTARCVEDFFLREIGRRKLITDDLAKINIYFTENQVYYIRNNIKSFLDVYIPFTFQEFSEAKTDFLKKKMVAETIFRALYTVFEHNLESLSILNNAYQKIADRRFENISTYKNKFFRSKRNKFFARLRIVYGISNYQVIVDIFDERKTLLGSKVVFQYNRKYFDVEKVYWDDKDLFCVKFKGPKKVFETSVNEVMSENTSTIYHSLSDWFKVEP